MNWFEKDINLGFATALPDGNLIVPNIKKSMIWTERYH